MSENLISDNSELSFYKQALDLSSVVAITDTDGTIIFVNDNFCKISGYSREELIGQNPRVLNSGFHPKEFFSNLWDTLLAGKVWRGDVKNKAKDGSVYWVDTTILPFIDKNGKPYKFMVIRHDITDKVKALALKEMFMATISHEIRTPLNSITNFIELLQKTKLNVEQHEYTELIQDSSALLLRLANDLLDIYRFESGMIHFEKMNFNLTEIISQIVHIYKIKIKTKGLKIISDVDSDIPEFIIGDLF
ncbi:MAG: PAS domain S-box protein, partial [Bacteroidetes bacterium]|nr:PAS domain S-box protein [Bacteroidota bacterium]